MAESVSRLEPQGSTLSTRLELPQPPAITETATALALRRRWLILGVVLVGSFMAILDVFIVTQGLPSIRTTLGAGVSDLELVVSAYSLVYAVFLITGGRLGDILDRKLIFLFGMTVFTVASTLAGYAPSPSFLIGSRALQGLGAALMYPQVLSIIQVTFKGAERSLALALFAAISGIGAITGNVLGGLLIQLNLAGLAWRPIFLVNVPVGIIGVLAGFLVLRPSRADRPPRLDLPGVGLISLFLVSLILPLAEGQQLGWPDWMVMLLVLAFPILALFVLYERRRTDNGEDPLVDMDLFKHRSFAVGIPLTLIYYVTASGIFFTLVLFLQSGLGFSPIISGLSFAVINVGFISASLLGPRLLPRFGTRVLSLAYILQTIGLAATILTQLLWNKPQPVRTSSPSPSIRSRRRVRPLTTTGSYTLRRPQPGRGRSLRRSLHIHADREHSRHLTLRTPLLQLPQRTTISDFVLGRVQADSSLLRHTGCLRVPTGLPPLTTSCEADHPALGGQPLRETKLPLAILFSLIGLSK